MLLEGKNVVIYGGGGAVGGAVARTFAGEGAKVYLAGRTGASLETVASDIEKAGGRAEVAELDALDEQAIERHISGVVERAGSIDVSFNAISIQDVQSIPLVEMSREDFMRPYLDGRDDAFPDREGGGQAYGRAGLGRDPDVLRLGRPRVLPRRTRWRIRDRVHGHRGFDEAARGGARARWYPRELPAFGRNT